MQVNRNTAIYAGQDEKGLRHGEEAQLKKSAGGKSISINAGAVMKNGQEDNILMKKQLARKKALKIVGDTFAADKKIDAGMDESREEMKELSAQKNELQGLISSYENMPEEEMTEEMRAEKEESLRQYRSQQNMLEAQIEGIGHSLTSSKINRLKSNPMEKAQETADGILESASQDVIGMLWQEAKDHVDEEQEKKVEEAEETAEKKEEQEEKLEKAREERKEQEEFVELVKEASSMDDVKREINDMLDKMKLIEEDIKGAQVDEQL